MNNRIKTLLFITTLYSMHSMHSITQKIVTYKHKDLDSTITFFGDWHRDSLNNPLVPAEQNKFIAHAKKYKAAAILEDTLAFSGNDPRIKEYLQDQVKINRFVMPDRKIKINGISKGIEPMVSHGLSIGVKRCLQENIPACSAQCRQFMSASCMFIKDYGISGKEAWQSLITEAEKIIDYSIDEDERNTQGESLAWYYIDQAHSLIDKKQQLSKLIWQLKKPISALGVNIVNSLYTLGYELFEAHVVRNIQLLKRKHKHIFVFMGMDHCPAVGEQLEKMGYERICGIDSTLKRHQDYDEIDRIDIDDYFKQLDATLVKGDANQQQAAAAAATPQERKDN